MLENGDVRIKLKETDRFGNHVIMNFEGVNCIIGNEEPFIRIQKSNGTATFIAHDAVLSLAFTPAGAEA